MASTASIKTRNHFKTTYLLQTDRSATVIESFVREMLVEPTKNWPRIRVYAEMGLRVHFINGKILLFSIARFGKTEIDPELHEKE